MKLKVIFTYDVNPETGEMKLLAKEEMTVDTSVEVTTKSTKKSTKKVDSNPEPIVTLDSNKLNLTQGAVDLLQICEDCRVDIKYEKKNGTERPVIGTDSAFSTKGGNKLTKSNTVSYRGSANERLSQYGTVFKLEPTENKGIYYLVGDKEPEQLEIPEEIIDIESELDIDNLDDIDFIEDEKELSKFEFKF